MSARSLGPAGCGSPGARGTSRTAVRPYTPWDRMRSALRPLAPERFDLQEVSFPKVDGAGCVRVKTNPYSVPAPVGTCVEAKLGSAHVELWAEGQCLARHERSYVRFAPVLELEHYLDVLERKPGALAGSTPLAQCRARGLWPASYDALWALDHPGKLDPLLAAA